VRAIGKCIEKREFLLEVSRRPVRHKVMDNPEFCRKTATGT
jgi:hypothetical protein